MGNLVSRRKHLKKSNKIYLLIDELNNKEENRIIELSKTQLKNNDYTKEEIIVNLNNYVQLYNLQSRNKFVLLKEFILELEHS
jgi:hypothetical protein